MNKKITSKSGSGDSWIVFYDDGSIDVTCSNCGKIDELKPDHKMSASLNQIDEAYKTYVCYSCWQKNRDAEKSFDKNETQDRIANAQAFNLAVASLSEEDKQSFGSVIKEEIKDRQQWFYNELTNRKVVEEIEEDD